MFSLFGTKECNSLPNGQDSNAFWSAGYQGIKKRSYTSADITWHAAMRLGKRRELDKDGAAGGLNDKAEKITLGDRTKVEYPFWVIKRLFGFEKVRYVRWKKNTDPLVTLFSLPNLTQKLFKA